MRVCARPCCLVLVKSGATLQAFIKLDNRPEQFWTKHAMGRRLFWGANRAKLFSQAAVQRAPTWGYLARLVTGKARGDTSLQLRSNTMPYFMPVIISPRMKALKLQNCPSTTTAGSR